MTTKAQKAAAESNTETQPESAQADAPQNETATLRVTGALMVRIAGEKYTHDDEFEVTAEQLASQGVKHLFISKQVEFADDHKRTKAYIASIKVKKDRYAGKSVEQLEDGGEFK